MSKPWPEWKLDRLRKLWGDPEVTCWAMASRLGVSEAAVNAMAKALNLPPRKEGNRRKAAARAA